MKTFDLENERAIVVASLNDSTARRMVVGAIDSDDFQGARFQTIFEAIVQCERKGLEPDRNAIASLADGDYGGLDFLRMLEQIEVSKNLEFHISKLREDSARAKVRNALKEFDLMLADHSIGHNEVIKRIAEFQSMLRVDSMLNDSNADSYLQDFDRRCASGSMFVSTGYLSIDSQLVEGFSKGTISVIAARTGHGKTSFVVDSVRRMLGSTRQPRVLVVPTEIGRMRFLDKLIASITCTRAQSFRKNPHELTLQDRDLIRDTSRKILNGDRLVVIDNPFFELADRSGRWPNEAALDKMESIIAEGNFDVVFWDLWQRALIDTSPSAIETAIVRMQFISARYQTHNCIVHQISRKAEERKRSERKPRMTDLKGSGGLEEVPDVALLIYRAKVYKPWIRNDIMEISIGKQRDGVVGRTMLCDFYPEVCRLDNDRLADIKDPNVDESDEEEPASFRR